MSSLRNIYDLQVQNFANLDERLSFCASQADEFN